MRTFLLNTNDVKMIMSIIQITFLIAKQKIKRETMQTVCTYWLLYINYICPVTDSCYHSLHIWKDLELGVLFRCFILELCTVLFALCPDLELTLSVCNSPTDHQQYKEKSCLCRLPLKTSIKHPYHAGFCSVDNVFTVCIHATSIQHSYVKMDGITKNVLKKCTVWGGLYYNNCNN